MSATIVAFMTAAHASRIEFHCLARADSCSINDGRDGAIPTGNIPYEQEVGKPMRQQEREGMQSKMGNRVPVIVMSINPKWVRLILTGQKTFELRRRAPSETPSTLLVYATNPISAIVAIGEIECILRGSPEILWRNIGPSSACTRDEFFDYFNGTDTGAAMKLIRMEPISPIPLAWLRERLEWHPPRAIWPCAHRAICCDFSS